MSVFPTRPIYSLSSIPSNSTVNGVRNAEIERIEIEYMNEVINF